MHPSLTLGEDLDPNKDPDITHKAIAIQLALHTTFITALGTLRSIGLQHRFFDIVQAICDSNNTKEVKGKTEAGIKANIDKGDKYISPTNTLAEILAEEKGTAND